MAKIELLTINKNIVHAEEMADIVERAYDFFPYNLWDGVEVLGGVEIPHDTKIKINGESYPAHTHINLIEKLKKVKETLKIDNPLIGISYDPLVRPYVAYDSGMMRVFVELLIDYVHKDIVAYSSFGVSPSKSTDFAVHTLGHLGGLRHHEKPTDIMYYALATDKNLKINFLGIFHRYFCKRCKRNLKEYLEEKSR